MQRVSLFFFVVVGGIVVVTLFFFFSFSREQRETRGIDHVFFLNSFTMTAKVVAPVAAPMGDGLKAYYQGKIEELELAARDKAATLRRLEAQRNELNSKGVFFFAR